jgi:membrane protein
VKRVWSVTLAVWRIMGERRLGLLAAGVAFFAMLALFPALAALIGIFGFVADPVVVEEALELGSEFLPEEALELIEAQIADLLDTASPALGLTSAISLLMAAWWARLGVDALIQGLTAIYGGNPRGNIRSTLTAITLTVILIAVGVTALAAMLVIPIFLAIFSPFIPVGSWVPVLAEALRWGVSIAVVVVGLGVFYRYGPNRPESGRSPFLSAGLLLALALWSAASLGFSLYLSHFDTYNEIYGSIGAAIVLMLWFYISAYAVLMGGALNFVLEDGQIQSGRET